MLVRFIDHKKQMFRNISSCSYYHGVVILSRKCIYIVKHPFCVFYIWKHDVWDLQAKLQRQGVLFTHEFSLYGKMCSPSYFDVYLDVQLRSLFYILYLFDNESIWKKGKNYETCSKTDYFVSCYLLFECVFLFDKPLKFEILWLFSRNF